MGWPGGINRIKPIATEGLQLPLTLTSFSRRIRSGELGTSGIGRDLGCAAQQVLPQQLRQGSN